MINNQTKLKKIIALVILSFVLFVGVFYFSPVLAQTGDTFGISSVDQNIALGGGDIRVTIAKIIRAVLGLLGIIAVVIVLYGGFTFMTAGGNEEKVAQGKKILINGIIGLLIILSSFIIVQFVLGKLSEATGLTPPGNPLCDDPIDAQNNPCPNPEFPTPCEDLHFVVTSITPVTVTSTPDVGMNNVVGRVVFSRRLSSSYNESNIGNFISIEGVDNTDLTFNIKTGDDYKNSLVEIQYVGDHMCVDGTSSIPCLPFGNYKIKVDESIQDLQGNYLETITSCDDFLPEGSFKIAGNNQGQTGNYSTPTTSFAIFHSNSYLQSSDKFSLDNVGISVWIKPDLPQKAGNDGDNYTIFQFENYPVSRYNLYLADLEDADSNNEDRIYLVWEYGVEGKSEFIDLGLREDLNGKWSNIIVTHNKNENYKIFINGDEKLSRSVSESDRVGVDDSTLFLGGSDLIADDGFDQAVSRFFVGQIHNFYLYNQTLSTELVNNLYSDGRGLYNYDWDDSFIHLALNDNSGINIVNSASDLRFNNYNLNWVTEEGEDTGSTTSEAVESGLKVDKTPPNVSPIKFVNRKTGEEKINYLPAGGTYIVSSEIVDKIDQADGGVGYVHMNFKRVDSDGNEFNLFDGPSIEDGSRTTDAKPFNFSYEGLYISPNAKVLDKYLLTLDVYDQDSNHTVVTTTFTIVAEYCDNGVIDGDEREADMGGSCGSGDGENCFDDLDCAFTYQCVDAVGDAKYENKTCQPYPYIEDVDPMDGGSGNWVSILGYNFGSYVKDGVTGTIEFGIDTDDDDKPDSWKPVSIVTCGESENPSWNDGWIIVEVPDDIIIPQDSQSVIRLTTARKIQKAGQYITLQDTTVDDWGPNPGPKDRKGWFLKNNILRPGLCRVENESLDYLTPVFGKIKDPVKGIGKGFGSSGKLYFDTVLSGIRGWSDSVVRGFVPNMAEGRVPVYVESVGGQRSNKVPFTIGADSESQKPVIVSIDPATTTPGSFVTIFGRNFGDAPGRLYWTDSSGGSRCSIENCARMSLDGMPPFCSETWSSNQIIVKIPEDIVFGQTEENINFIKKFVTVENNLGFYSSGENDFQIHDDEPLPSICALSPNYGPAPREDQIQVKGINFSSDPTVYFFTDKSELTGVNSNITGWLQTPFSDIFLRSVENEDDGGQVISTPIPYNLDFGYSMKIGLSPIKVKDQNNKFSNSIYYDVQDCRIASSTIPGYQCCGDDSPEAGKWKPENIGCFGSSKDAGYVWRFTTGLLPDNPFVVVSCDQDNYDSTGEFPSPVPSVDWRSGQNACTNSVVAVRFGPSGMTMNEESINTATVKVYKCGGEDQFNIENCEADSINLSTDCDSQVGCLNLQNNILNIYIPPLDFTTGTWFHVELMEDIKSQKEYEEFGQTIVETKNLWKTRPLGEAVENEYDGKVAFNFNFKTGDKKCVLTGAGMIPAEHTTNRLGIVQDPKYKFVFSSKDIFGPIFPQGPVHPLYYFLWGKGDQECSVMNVDGLGWNWRVQNGDNTRLNEKWAEVEKAPTYDGELNIRRKYTDSRSMVTAWTNTAPFNVWILANLNISSDKSILSSAGVKRGTPGVTGNNDGYYIVNDSTGKYTLKNGSNYKINFTLGDVPDEKYDISIDPLDKKIYKNRVLLNKGMVLWTNEEAETWYEENGGEEAIFNYSPGAYYLVVSEVKNRNLSSSGELVDTTLVSRTLRFWYATSLDSAVKVVDLVLSTSTDDYSINLSVENNRININDGISTDTFLLNNLIQSNDQPLLVGTGSTSTEGNNYYGLYGRFNKLEFLDSGSENFTTITATSSLKIDLLDPKVLEYWPNCIEACINTDFGVRFNMSMMMNTYNNVELYKCDDEQACIDKNFSNNSLENLSIQTPSETSNEETLSFNYSGTSLEPDTLEPDTWYLVRLKNGIKAIGGFESGFENGDVSKPVAGKSLTEFTWKFKTRNNPSPCLAESVDVLPDPLQVYSVGQKDKIQAQPNGAPDSCNPNGQKLNPWFFTWDWDSFNHSVFSITKFATSNSLSPYCNKNCLYKGSDISRSEEPVYLCGNGVIDPGEDCDIALESNVPNSCNYICLRPGNSDFVSATTTVDVGKCGDGYVNYTVGEECDPGIVEQKSYCSNNCLKQGSSKVVSLEDSVPYCGSGSVTNEEDCDIAKDTKDNLGKIGCSENCLHTGTQLSQMWCDQSGRNDSVDVCKDAYASSVCGNGVIETGEECDYSGTNQIKFLTGSNVSDFSIFTTTSPENYCNSRCLAQNICDVSSLKNSILYCEAGTEGCNNDCTLAGSSVLYADSTICGDGEIETGEFGACEVDPDKVSAQYAGAQSPVQVTTAVGEEGLVGEIPGLSGVKGQMSTSSARTVGYFDEGSIKNLGTADVRTGLGDYYLVCGYKEFMNPDGAGQYNLCPTNGDNKKGVATNSCCYNRPVRVAEYPVDAEGLIDRGGVCRNTYIETVIDGYINPNKVSSNNFGLVIGYERNHVCTSTPGSVDMTDQVKEVVGNSEIPGQLTFLGRIWHGIKTFFARLFGMETKAIADSYGLVDDIEVWCTVPTPLSFNVSNDLDFIESEDGRPENRVLRSATTTISAYLGDILGENQVYGVLLLGGKDGIQDIKGVSIKNANDEITSINDIWFFKTGNQICKISSITVAPESYLFDTPNTSADFGATAISLNEDKSENKIVSTPAYEWEWSWGPAEHKVFDIPSATNPYNTISARNVEGETTALVKALVTRDVDGTSGNHKGRFFTASSDLTAMFCANPWPAKDEDGSWKPYTDNYYNFSFSYCADDGISGDLDDDLPFFVMRDVTKDYSVERCEIGSQLCSEDNDCPIYWNLPYNNGISAKFSELCAAGKTYEELIKNNCNLFESTSGDMNYCHQFSGSSLYPPEYNKEYRTCLSDSDCDSSLQESCIPLDRNWVARPKVNNDTSFYPNRCVVVPTNAPTVFTDTLQRKISFDKNDRSDDVFGLQIFKNENRLSAVDWYKNKFPNSNPQSVEIAGYEAVKDGNNYYISAKNIVEEASVYAKSDYKIYYNIYNFSINQGASEDTQKVLSQVLESLVFNLNISDYGYCLDASVLDNTRLSMNSDVQKAISGNNLTCLNDFDCRDTNGVPLEGTNGVCSNAKTKFFRDLDRLQRIKNTQSALDNYFVNKNNYNFTGALKGGTYIPGYTVSTWASWNDTLGKYANTSLPQDNINAWTSCTDSEAESQTCWNADKLTYSCPAYSSVFEYEYVSSTNSYILHAPLEYLTSYSHFVVGNEVGDMNISTSTFTTDPFCKGESYSLNSGICGDGIVQPGSGEECDLPGSVKISNEGYILDKPGKCDYISVEKECGVDNDCPKVLIGGYIVAENSETKVCNYNGSLIYGDVRNNEIEVFHCSEDEECLNKETYTRSDSKEIHTLYPISNFVVNDDWQLSPIDGFECLSLGDNGAYDELNFGNCVGRQLASTEPASCPSGYSAHSTCDSSCSWSYGACMQQVKCGNGFVEGVEACDDGPLNGKYGQCNSSCTGLSEQYCGNGKQDFSGSSPLELCENLGDKTYSTYTGSVRYCEHNPNIIGCVPGIIDCPEYDTGINGLTVGVSMPDKCVSGPSETTLLENANSGLLSCDTGSAFCRYISSNNNINKIYTGYCSKNKAVLCNTNGDCGVPIDFNNHILTKADVGGNGWLNKFTTSTEFVGPCLTEQGKVGSLYNFNKENSCSWDCQKYGQYCGDEVPNGDEECDDGNTINDGDGCNNNCQKIVDYVAPVCGNTLVEGSEVCDLGKFCADLKKHCTSDSDCKNNDGTLIVDGICKLREALDGSRTYYCSADCKTKTNYISSCGNGVVDESDDPEKNEFCDGGVNNGKICVPGYGESCTYCSSDCKKIFTIDSPNYCGNGKIDLINPKTNIYETCDRLSDGTAIENDKINNNKPIGTTKSCPDKGSYTCTDCSQSPGNTCYKCEDGYTVPRLNLINVTGQKTDLVGSAYSLYFMRWNPGQAKIIKQQLIENYDKPLELDNGINLNDECKSEYRFGFGNGSFGVMTGSSVEGGRQDSIKFGVVTTTKEGQIINISTADVFEFPKAGTSDSVYNDFIFSPAVPEGVFRAVVVWEGDDIEPMINVYNPDLKNIYNLSVINETTKVFNFGVEQKSIYCQYNNPLGSCAINSFSGVYFHPLVTGKILHTKSITINTKDELSSNYKIFLTNLTNKKIGSLKNRNIKVYVYGYNNGQNNEFSVFEPINIFDISNVDDNGGNDSPYWYVFDLKNNENNFNVIPQGSQSNGSLWLKYSDFNDYKNNVVINMTLNKLSLYVDNFIYYVDGSLHQNITSSTPFGLFDIYLENLNNDVTSSLNINIEECEVSRSIRYNNALEIVKKNFKDLFNDQSYIFSTYPSEYNISRNIFDSFTKCNLDFSQLEQDIPYSLIVKLKNNIEDYQYGYNEFLVSEMNSNSDIRNGIKKYNNTFGSIFDNVFLNSFDIYLELGDEENNGWNKIYNNKNNNNNFYKLINIIKRSNQVLEISKVYEFTNL